MNLPKGGIAFFDSGIGGMTVLAACQSILNDELFYYYGDNIHAPYGNLPPKQIREYVFDAFEKFRALDVKAAVVACNTATAVCIEELRRTFDFPILGAEPAIRLAARAGGRVLVLTTQATYKSQRYQTLLTETRIAYPKVELVTAPCERLAYEIEKNIKNATFDYTPFLPRQKADGVVLGCTHYVYIEAQIAAYYGCPVYHGNGGIARRLYTLLRGNRDGRPPDVFELKNLGFSTTIFPKNPLVKEVDKKANKRLHQNPLNPLKNQGKGEVVFLGESAENNEKIYKQTYVRKQDGFLG